MYLKKFIFFFVLSCLFIIPCKAITPTVEYQENLYSNRIAVDKTYSGQMGFLVVEDKVVFCLDPYKVVGDNYEIDNTKFNNYDEDDLDYIKLVSIYVDKYIQQRNIYYYMAAQELIWERLYGMDTVYFTTEKDGKGTEIDLITFKSEIEQYVDNFLIKPSFDRTIVKDNFYTTIILEDANEVLSEYEIINESANSVWKNGNSLYIKILSSKLSDIKLIRKIDAEESIYYYSSTNQDLAYLNSSFEKKSEISIQANNEYNENIVVNFYDKEIKGLISEAVKFKIIDLDSGEVIVDTETYNGMYYTNLTAGNYEFRVENVSDKYLIPDVRYFNINEEEPYSNRSIIINFNRPAGKLNVNIYKEGIYKLYFKNEDTDDLIDTFEETKSFDLKLGSYYVIDISNDEKYEFTLEYKDAITPIIIYNLDIYPDKTGIDDSQDGLDDDNLNDEIVDTEEDSASDEEETKLEDKNDSTKDESSVNVQDKNDPDDDLNNNPEIDNIEEDENLNEEKVSDEKMEDNNVNEEQDDTLNNEKDNFEGGNNVDDEPNCNENNDLKEDKPPDEENKVNNKIESEDIKSEIPPLNIQDNIISSKDNIISNDNNLQTLPNTSNYIKTLKSYLFVFLLLGLIIRFRKQ